MSEPSEGVEVSAVDLLAFFREAVLAPPHPNPEGGHEWFHGTPHHYQDSDSDEDDRYSPPRTPDKYEDEYFSDADHWNTGLGSHWTSEQHTAEFFANGQSHSRTPTKTARVAHAELHMANPKHYETEFDMTAHAINWSKKNGYRHLPSGEKDHEHFRQGETDEMTGETRSGNGGREKVDYDGHPHASGSMTDRSDISSVDREPHDADLVSRYGGRLLDQYLGAHPFKSEITQGFKKHLQSKGHDGVTYGNMYEEPRGHTCAIPFDDDHIHLKKWRYLNPDSPHSDVKAPPEEIPGQQALVKPTWTPEKKHHWLTHDGKEAALSEPAPSVDELLRMMGIDPERNHHPGLSKTLAEQGGEVRRLPTPSHDMPEEKGYFPGDDLSGMFMHPKVAWVKTQHLLKHREYDRRDPKQQTHESDANIERIKSEMTEHGMREPLIMEHDPHSDRARLGEGNHRLAAAAELGWPAVPVHVVRAYKGKFSATSRGAVPLGSHKVHPDEHGYTPGNLHPRDALPDHYLYDGESKTATHWSEPRPGYDDADDYDTNRNRRNDWEHETRKALSRGDLSAQQAVDNGYHGKGHDQGNGRHGTAESLSWAKMPERLFHVTTDLKGVLAHGLKSRKELAQSQGKGLGGGDDDTISFTEDHQLAGHILDSLHEFHDVANGRKTPRHMYDEAKAGVGASRPFHEDMLTGMHPHEIHAMLQGKVVQQKYATQDEMDARGDGKWEPHPGSQPLNGTHDMLWHRDATDDEKLDHAVRLYKRFSFMREHAGGKPDPVFFSTDVKGFAGMDPKNFGIVHAKPKPGAQGYQMGSMGEWRTADGNAVDIHHHRTTAARRLARWLPHDRIFGPGKGGLDPRLFNKKKIMKPEVAAVILGDLDAYWAPTYPDWRDWTRVYLAGSEASEWYGNNDFDTLMGIDHAKMRKAHPEFDGMADDDIDAYLTKGLRENLNNEDWIAPWDGQVWHRTYYVNPNSWDIRDIKPYAAYDITRKIWAVEPFHPGADWGPEKLPSSFWDEAESIVKQVKAIEKMPDPYRAGRGAALFDMLHGDRRRAFGPNGTGVYDPGNATWKYLDMHPDHPLASLVDLKREYENGKVPV